MQEKGAPQKVSEAPCSKEAGISLKCLDKANYDKAACQTEFDAYKECKKAEVATRAQRRLEKEHQERQKRS